MKIVVAHVRGSRTPWADQAAEDYGRRIARYFPYEERVLKEGATLEVPPRGRLVVLDERGEDLSSEGLAALLEACARDGVTMLVFAIGGAYGHSDEVRARGWKTIRLSRMVLAHAVARVVLTEQIFRACTIRAGEPYHHG